MTGSISKGRPAIGATGTFDKNVIGSIGSGFERIVVVIETVVVKISVSLRRIGDCLCKQTVQSAANNNIRLCVE